MGQHELFVAEGPQPPSVPRTTSPSDNEARSHLCYERMTTFAPCYGCARWSQKRKTENHLPSETFPHDFSPELAGYNPAYRSMLAWRRDNGWSNPGHWPYDQRAPGSE